MLFENYNTWAEGFREEERMAEEVTVNVQIKLAEAHRQIETLKKELHAIKTCADALATAFKALEDGESA